VNRHSTPFAFAKNRYPYLLPNFAGAVGAVVSLLLVIVYLPETKDFEKQRRYKRHADEEGGQSTPSAWLPITFYVQTLFLFFSVRALL